MKLKCFRSGFTLLEMILVLAVVGVFLAMGAALLYGYARLHTSAARNLDSVTQWREMADMWRRDVRLADPAPKSEALPPGGLTELKLNRAGEQVIWKVEEEKVVRRSLTTKTEKSWSLGQGKSWAEFEWVTVGKPEVLTLRHGETKVNGRFVQAEYRALRAGDLP